MRKTLLILSFFSLCTICQAQEKNTLNYSITLFPPIINNPASSNYSASLNDAQTRLCFVRNVNGSKFPEIVISTRENGNEWSEPKKIYPTNDFTLSWTKGQLTGTKYASAYKKGSITLPDYQFASSPTSASTGKFINHTSGQLDWSIFIRSCKLSNDGKSILFHAVASNIHIVGHLTEQIDGTWSFREHVLPSGTGTIEFASNGEYFLGKATADYSLYRRDKLGSFKNEGTEMKIHGVPYVLANDNATWLSFYQSNGGAFQRYYDFKGKDPSYDIYYKNDPYIYPYEESTSVLSFNEGEINWLSRDLQTGIFTVGQWNEMRRIGTFKIEEPIYFQETAFVASGKIKPWNKTSDQLVRSNPVKSDDKPRVVKPTGKYYALIIGVSQYDDPALERLSRPRQDATKFKDILVSKYQFGSTETSLLLDPTREQILSEFNRLRRVITANDNLLIFYAGHGKWDESVKQGYWLPRNAASNNEANWISNSDIKEQIRAIQSGHTLLISDACFSGGIFRSRSAESIKTANYDIVALYKMPSRRAMTSGTYSTVPDNSVFFDYLTKRLMENEEKFLPSTTLFDSFRRAVINNTVMVVPQDGVIAETGDEGGDFIFIKRD